MLRLVTLTLLFTAALTFPNFGPKFPNGEAVPNPCGGFWSGVGHLRQTGGGPLNSFGTDFQANGNVWNAALCRMDSDGDGVSNGAELGDPNCLWTPTNGHMLDRASGHPGICEPVGSLACSVSQFTCR